MNPFPSFPKTSDQKKITAITESLIPELFNDILPSDEVL
jgi:hypothetical protein